MAQQVPVVCCTFAFQPVIYVHIRERNVDLISSRAPGSVGRFGDGEQHWDHAVDPRPDCRNRGVDDFSKVGALRTYTSLLWARHMQSIIALSVVASFRKALLPRVYMLGQEFLSITCCANCLCCVVYSYVPCEKPNRGFAESLCSLEPGLHW